MSVIRLIVFIALVAMLACSSGGGAEQVDFPLDAYATVGSPSGDLLYALRSAPTQPPARGAITLLLTVTSADGSPADGLAIDIEPWMPAMGHGASITPSITPRGNGEYLVSDLVLVMPGTWQLRVSAASATTIIPLTVQ